MDISFEEKLFWSVTLVTVIAAMLTIMVSLFSGLQFLVETLILFGSISSIGWVGVIAYLASK